MIVVFGKYRGKKNTEKTLLIFTPELPIEDSPIFPISIPQKRTDTYTNAINVLANDGYIKIIITVISILADFMFDLRLCN